MPTPAAEQAFLQPILARYTDDGPRLVFADFLDESDDPADHARADLIRVQCALARLPDDHPRRDELAHLQSELLQQYQSVWADHLRDLEVGPEWRRGLLDAVSVDAGTFLARGDELFRRAAIRRVKLVDAARHAARLAHCPFLARVRELDLCGNDLGNGGVNVLLRSPYLTRVEDLDLSFNGLSDGGAKLLARSPALPRLRSLALTDNRQISSDGVTALAESPHFAGLRVLDVSGNSVGDAGVRALTGSRFLTRLHTLRLTANQIGDTGTATLAGSVLLGRMVARSPSLNLQQNAIGPAGAQALADSPHLAAVATLDLSGNIIGDLGLGFLALSPHLSKLRRLLVRQNHFGDPGAATLAESPLMARLTFLDVSANRLTHKGVDRLWAARRDFHVTIEAAGNLVSDDPAGPSRYGPPPPHTLDEEVGRILRRYTGASRPGGTPT